MNPLTRELRELEAKATAGPWMRDQDTIHSADCNSQHRPEYSYAGQFCNCTIFSSWDAALIVFLRNNALKLAERMEKLEAENVVLQGEYEDSRARIEKLEAIIGKATTMATAIENSDWGMSGWGPRRLNEAREGYLKALAALDKEQG